DEDLPRKQKSLQQKLKRRYEKGDLTVGLLGEPSGKFDYYVLYPKAKPSQPPSPIEMDMSYFPCMLQFKRKMLPHAQLLRWSNWFSQWKFTLKHIKVTENILADFLSRPKAYKLEENYPKDASRVQNYTSHFLSMVFLVASHKEEGSSSNTTPTVPIFDLPVEIVETIGDLTFEKRAKICYKMFLTILLKNHGLAVREKDGSWGDHDPVPWHRNF
nr:putative reverse transcriptase domain, viral movement protein [Tanacetum cinerariifolium]